MNLRKTLLSLIRAGYHRQEVTLVSPNDKITQAKADQCYQLGVQAHEAGIKCHCPLCEETFKP